MVRPLQYLKQPLGCLQGYSPISNGIITATYHTALTTLTVQVSAPTNCANPDVKDAIYQEL